MNSVESMKKLYEMHENYKKHNPNAKICSCGYVPFYEGINIQHVKKFKEGNLIMDSLEDICLYISKIGLKNSRFFDDILIDAYEKSEEIKEYYKEEANKRRILSLHYLTEKAYNKGIISAKDILKSNSLAGWSKKLSAQKTIFNKGDEKDIKYMIDKYVILDLNSLFLYISSISEEQFNKIESIKMASENTNPPFIFNKCEKINWERVQHLIYINNNPNLKIFIDTEFYEKHINGHPKLQFLRWFSHPILEYRKYLKKVNSIEDIRTIILEDLEPKYRGLVGEKLKKIHIKKVDKYNLINFIEEKEGEFYVISTM